MHMAKILVIDDEPTVRELMGRLLRRQGYDVVLAESGEKGLELFRGEHPDVVVLDLKMPGMDGLEVLQQVRSLNPDQPVIMLTGAGTPEKEHQVHALGVSEFVAKEFSLHLLGDARTRILKNGSKPKQTYCESFADSLLGVCRRRCLTPILGQYLLTNDAFLSIIRHTSGSNSPQPEV